MTVDRRTFLKMSGSGLLACKVAGVTMMLTPAQARSQGVPYQVFNAHEAESIETLGEVLLPGAKKAGIAHFIDHQLAGSIRDTKLAVRILPEVMPPYRQFYQQGLSALENVCRHEHQTAFKALKPAKQRALIKTLANDEPANWDGPPSRSFYFALRSDAVDVVYGTVEGSEKLGLPSMAHLNPMTKW